MHVRAVPSTFYKYLRASRIAVPAAAFVSPPPLPFVANTTGPPHQRTSEMSAWPCALTVKPGDCDTGRASMPTATLETQLFSPVGPTPQPPLSGAAPPIRGWLSHSWRQCKTYSSRQGATGCGDAVLRRPCRPPYNPTVYTVAAACLCRRLPPAYRRREISSPPTYKNASCDHAPTSQPLVRPSYGDVAR